MKSRNVRMSGTHIAARLDRRVVEVSNLSLTGALLVLDESLPVDSQATLALGRDSVEVTIEAQVLRSAQDRQSSRWLVAVRFVDLSVAAKKAIPQLLSKSSRGR